MRLREPDGARKYWPKSLAIWGCFQALIVYLPKEIFKWYWPIFFLVHCRHHNYRSLDHPAWPDPLLHIIVEIPSKFPGIPEIFVYFLAIMNIFHFYDTKSCNPDSILSSSGNLLSPSSWDRQWRSRDKLASMRQTESLHVGDAILENTLKSLTI